MYRCQVLTSKVDPRAKHAKRVIILNCFRITRDTAWTSMEMTLSDLGTAPPPPSLMTSQVTSGAPSGEWIRKIWSL